MLGIDPTFAAHELLIAGVISLGPIIGSLAAWRAAKRNEKVLGVKNGQGTVTEMNEKLLSAAAKNSSRIINLHNSIDSIADEQRQQNKQLDRLETWADDHDVSDDKRFQDVFALLKDKN